MGLGLGLGLGSGLELELVLGLGLCSGTWMAVGWSGMFVERERAIPLFSTYCKPSRRIGAGSSLRRGGLEREAARLRSSRAIVSASCPERRLGVTETEDVFATVSPAIHEAR